MSFRPNNINDLIYDERIQIILFIILSIITIPFAYDGIITISEFLSAIAIFLAFFAYLKTLDQGPNFVIQDVHGEETVLSPNIFTPIIRIRFIIQNIGDKMGYIEFESIKIVIYSFINITGEEEFLENIIESKEVNEQFQMQSDTQIPKALSFEFTNQKEAKIISSWNRAKLNIKGFYTTHKGTKQNFNKNFSILKDNRHENKF